MLNLSLILGLLLISSIFSSTIYLEKLGHNTKTRMNPSEDSQSIPSNKTFYFTTDFIDNLYLEITVPQISSIQFKVGVNSYELEPSDQDVVDGQFSQVEDFTIASEDEELIYTYILTSFTDKNKPFVTISITNLQEVEYFDLLVKNGDTPQGVKVYYLPFNQEVELRDEIDTPLYFNVSLPEQIKENKISFNIKVPKNKLNGAKFSVSGYSSAPDIEDFTKNLIAKKEDQKSEVSEDGDYDINKYSVDKIEGANYLLLNIETESSIELIHVFVKVYSEDEEKRENETETGNDSSNKGGEEPKEIEHESKGWPITLIVILCIIVALIVFVVIFLVAKKMCCKPKEVTSESIEKNFSPKESNELN